MAAKTRLGLSATPRAPYGSFAGKTTESGLTVKKPKLQNLGRQFATQATGRLGGVLVT